MPHTKPPIHSLSAIFVLSVACCLGHAQGSLPTLPSQSLAPRCAALAATGTQFGPVAEACQLALSPAILPAFVCHEKIQRFAARGFNLRQWDLLDDFTMEVTFEPGNGERYSNFARNGKPIASLAKPQSGDEIFKFLMRTHVSGLVDLSHFGQDLLLVFDPENRASFEYKGEIDGADKKLTSYSYRIKKSDPGTNSSVGMRYGKQFAATAVEGNVWTDTKTGLLKRVLLRYTEIDPHFPISGAATTTEYGVVKIEGLGEFLLPIGGDGFSCERNGGCLRNVFKYDQCHKFAAESRILPDATSPDDH